MTLHTHSFHLDIPGWSSTCAEYLSSLLSFRPILLHCRDPPPDFRRGWGVDALKTTPTVYDIHNGLYAVWQLPQLLPRLNPPSLQPFQGLTNSRWTWFWRMSIERHWTQPQPTFRKPWFHSTLRLSHSLDVIATMEIGQKKSCGRPKGISTLPCRLHCRRVMRDLFGWGLSLG